VVLPRKSKVLHAAEKLALQPHEGVRDAQTDPHDRCECLWLQGATIHLALPYDSKATNNDATVKLQALRDIYLIYKSVQLEEYSHETDTESQSGPTRRGALSYVRGYLAEYRDLAVVRRLRSALISSSTVNLAQQLCGSKSRLWPDLVTRGIR